MGVLSREHRPNEEIEGMPALGQGDSMLGSRKRDSCLVSNGLSGDGIKVKQTYSWTIAKSII